MGQEVEGGLSELQKLTSKNKKYCKSTGAVVAAQHPDAVDAGLEMIKKGGNAMDAAIAAAMVLNVVEPWGSGIGGGGFLVYFDSKTKSCKSLNYHMKTPKKLQEQLFQTVTDQECLDIFAMPKVIGDTNLYGPLSICVPGFLKGMEKAYQSFSRLSWETIMEPAIKACERGHTITHTSVLKCAERARFLQKCETSKQIWMPNDLPIHTYDDRMIHRVKLQALHATLKKIQQHGVKEFYQGEMAVKMADEIQKKGGLLDFEDMKNYEAFWQEPLSFEKNGHRYFVPPDHAAGQCFASVYQALVDLPVNLKEDRSLEFYKKAVQALKKRDELRLHQLGEAYLKKMKEPACTSHISVVDTEGNMVSLTNTLLSIFGSGVTSKSTGVLFNNGVYWLNPTKKHANGIRGNIYPLSNMCPMIATKNGQGTMAIGAAGGRRIMPAVLQTVLFAHQYNMGIDKVLHWPRIDTSDQNRLVMDDRLDNKTKSVLLNMTNAVEVSPFEGDYGYGLVSLVTKTNDYFEGAVCPFVAMSCVEGIEG